MSDLPSVDLTTIDFFPTGPLAEDEEYLWSILSDRSGIDIAEFTFVDEEKIDRCFRTRAYQQAWLRDNSRFQIEQNARDVGKALCLTTPIFTANRGWVTMGTIEVGDVVFDETGAQCNVTKVFAELVGRDCYEVRFDDNSTLVCDGEHEFETLSATWGRRVLTVRDIALSLTYGQNAPLHKPDLYKKWNHRIEVASPLDYGREADAAEVRSATPARALGFCWWQRVEVLQRHMDKHGESLTLGRRVRVKASPGLRALLRSLGVKFAENDGMLSWSPSGGLNPFMERVDEARPVDAVDSRYIVGVERVKSRPVRCITVDSPSHLYLAGDDFVATHNSLSILLRAVAWPFGFPGQDMLITAPRGVHLKPITERVEHHFFRSGSRLLEETLISKKNGTRQGISKMPAWSLQFANNARIVTRLPNIDGSGVKGSHIGHSVMVTADGLKRADEIEVGDLVLTGAGTYEPVRHVYSYEVDDAVVVSGKGHRGYVVGTNHRFLTKRNSNPQRARNLGIDTWLPVFHEELSRHYWATPASFPSLPLPDIPEGCVDGVALLELAGAYVADGCVTGRSRPSGIFGIRLIDAPDEIERLRDIAMRAGYNPRHAKQDSSAEAIVVNSYALGNWLVDHFGELSDGKTIPSWLLGAPQPAREAFLTTYLAGDGHWSQSRNRWETSTASKRLAIGVKLLAQSLGFATTFSWVDPKVTEIMGTKLKNKPKRSYRVQMSVGSKHALELEGKHWGKIRSAEPLGKKVRLYDFAIHSEHSYVGDGLISLGTAFMPDGSEA